MSWEALQPGDLVDVVAPGGKPKPNTLEGIESFLNSWGLKARVPRDIVERDLLCSNSREKRFKHLKNALFAKDSKMVWCVRGGYGALHLLPLLQKVKKPPQKIFLGFSDTSSLHTYFLQAWNQSTLHGPNIDRFALGTGTSAEEKRLKKLLFGVDKELSFQLKPLNQVAKSKKTLQGSVVGGNMVTLQASFGTPFQMQTRGKILFVEETGERAYKVDRIFEHMDQLGLLKGIKALVLGQFTEGFEPNGKNIFPKYFKEWAEEKSFPVLAGLPSGHGANPHTLPFGTKTQVQLGLKPRLLVHSGVKRR